jgi:hypothetical protein
MLAWKKEVAAYYTTRTKRVLHHVASIAKLVNLHCACGHGLVGAAEAEPPTEVDLPLTSCHAACVSYYVAATPT